MLSELVLYQMESSPAKAQEEEHKRNTNAGMRNIFKEWPLVFYLKSAVFSVELSFGLGEMCDQDVRD